MNLDIEIVDKKEDINPEKVQATKVFGIVAQAVAVRRIIFWFFLL